MQNRLDCLPPLPGLPVLSASIGMLPPTYGSIVEQMQETEDSSEPVRRDLGQSKSSAATQAELSPEQTVQAPAGDPATPVDSDDRSNPPSIANLPSSWRSWLKELDELSADAPEWGRVDALTTLIQRLAASKKIEREDRRTELKQAFAVLQVGVAGQELAYFEYPVVPNCDVDAYPLSQAPYLVGLLQDLETLLIRHQARRLQSSTTRAGERERQAELNSLAAEIEVSYHNIQEEMARPAARQHLPKRATQRIAAGRPTADIPRLRCRIRRPRLFRANSPCSQEDIPQPRLSNLILSYRKTAQPHRAQRRPQQDPAMSEAMAGTSEPGRE